VAGAAHRRRVRRPGHYGRLLRPGQRPGDVVFAEKVREDAIRDTGFRVVRWIWDELDSFGDVMERLRRAFAAA
jgi:hypothetical protein